MNHKRYFDETESVFWIDYMKISEKSFVIIS